MNRHTPRTGHQHARLLAAVGFLLSIPAAVQAGCLQDISSVEGANCPLAAGPCNITQPHTIATTCDLNLTGRDVVITTDGRLNIGTQALTIEANSLLIAAGGRIEGSNGSVTIDVDNGFSIVGTGTSASARGRVRLLKTVDYVGPATIDIHAGAVSINGLLEAKNDVAGASGGNITISTIDKPTGSGDVVFGTFATLSVAGGASANSGGGSALLHARGKIDITPKVVILGSAGGSFGATAAGAIALHGGVDGDATKESDGGEVTLTAGTTVTFEGASTLDGDGSADFDGNGGSVTIRAGSDVLLSTSITLDGDYEGDGGSIEISTGSGDVHLSGAVSLLGKGDRAGGMVTVEAARHVILDSTGSITATNLTDVGEGGTVDITAGTGGYGTLDVAQLVNVSAKSNCTGANCPTGGTITLKACDLNVAASGQLRANGASGGHNQLTASMRVAISGSLSALMQDINGQPGVNEVIYADNQSPLPDTVLSLGGIATPPLVLVPSPSLPPCKGCIAPTFSGFPCDDSQVCTANGICQNDGTCSQAPFVTSECRPAADLCDQAESCSGSAPQCPPDLLRPAQTVCRSLASTCDVEDVCNGTSASCPDNNSCDDGDPCTPDTCAGDGSCSSGPPLQDKFPVAACDDHDPCTLDGCIAGVCYNGFSIGIPNVVGSVCRAATGSCDVAEACSVVDASGVSRCPADTVKPASVTCRAANGQCDVTETCDGLAGTCAADSYAASGSPCADEGDTCTDDLCNGSGMCAHTLSAQCSTPTSTPTAVATATPADTPTPTPSPTTIPAATCQGGVIAMPKFRIGSNAAAPGNQRLKMAGEWVVSPLDPAIDPLANGFSFTVLDNLGTPPFSLTIPPGAPASTGAAGWRVDAGKSKWRFAAMGSHNIDGITKVDVKRGRRNPGLFEFSVRGSEESDFQVPAASLPVALVVTLGGTPQFDLGQCATVQFSGPTTSHIPKCTLSSDGNTLICR